jgi:hypothetical protein
VKRSFKKGTFDMSNEKKQDTEPTIESVTAERDEARRQLAMAQREIGRLQQLGISWEITARTLASTCTPVPVGAGGPPQPPQG